MVSMKKILLGAFGALLVGVAIAAALLQLGAIDMAADSPHHPAVYRLIAWTREQSILRRAANIVAPTDLADAKRIRRGAGNYDAMCANCHLSPGAVDSEIRKGLYPMPPNLSSPTHSVNPGSQDSRRFWIVKHGIKASGMPAWSKGGMEDQAIWDIIAFLNTLPDLTPEAYRRQVEASEGHSHGGLTEHTDTAAMAKPAPEHHHDTTPHSHKKGAHKQ